MPSMSLIFRRTFASIQRTKSDSLFTVVLILCSPLDAITIIPRCSRVTSTSTSKRWHADWPAHGTKLFSCRRSIAIKMLTFAVEGMWTERRLNGRQRSIKAVSCSASVSSSGSSSFFDSFYKAICPFSFFHRFSFSFAAFTIHLLKYSCIYYPNIV